MLPHPCALLRTTSSPLLSPSREPYGPQATLFSLEGASTPPPRQARISSPQRSRIPVAAGGRQVSRRRGRRLRLSQTAAEAGSSEAHRRKSPAPISGLQFLRRLAERRQEQPIGLPQGLADLLPHGVEERRRRLLDLLGTALRILRPHTGRPQRRDQRLRPRSRRGFVDLSHELRDPGPIGLLRQVLPAGERTEANPSVGASQPSRSSPLVIQIASGSNAAGFTQCRR